MAIKCFTVFQIIDKVGDNTDLRLKFNYKDWVADTSNSQRWFSMRWG